MRLSWMPPCQERGKPGRPDDKEDERERRGHAGPRLVPHPVQVSELLVQLPESHPPCPGEREPLEDPEELESPRYPEDRDQDLENTAETRDEEVDGYGGGADDGQGHHDPVQESMEKRHGIEA